MTLHALAESLRAVRLGVWCRLRDTTRHYYTSLGGCTDASGSSVQMYVLQYCYECFLNLHGSRHWLA